MVIASWKGRPYERSKGIALLHAGPKFHSDSRSYFTSNVSGRYTSHRAQSHASSSSTSSSELTARSSNKWRRQSFTHPIFSFPKKPPGTKSNKTILRHSQKPSRVRVGTKLSRPAIHRAATTRLMIGGWDDGRWFDCNILIGTGVVGKRREREKRNECFRRFCLFGYLPNCGEWNHCFGVNGLWGDGSVVRWIVCGIYFLVYLFHISVNRR